MGWWDALWLNEGFASRMEYLGTDFFAPGFGITRQFLGSSVQRSLRADAFADVQTLTQPVTSSAQIEGQFSAISYSKGAALIRMTQAFLDDLAAASLAPPNSFFAGVSAYIKTHAFANAEPAALWAALADASTVPQLAAWPASYETQPGFALVRVAWRDGDAAAAAAGGGVLTVSQSRFFASPASGAAAAAADPSGALTNLVYWVPLTFAAPPAALAAAPLAEAVARGRSDPLFNATWPYTIGSDLLPFNTTGGAWLKLNANATTYARVTYPPALWTALGAAAAASAGGAANGMSAADRASLLDDILTFGESTVLRGEGITQVTALAFAGSFVPLEAAYEGLATFLSHAGTLAAAAVPDVPFASAGDAAVDPLAAAGADAVACFADVTAWARAQIAPAVASLGWEPQPGEAPLTSQLRASVLSAASYLGDAGTISAARALYDAGVAKIPADFAQIVLSSVVRWGSPADWAAVQALYVAASAASDAAAARRYLTALTASRDRSRLAAALALAFTDAVRVGDKVSVIAGVAASPWGRDLAWAALKANWATLSALYGAGGFDTSALVAAAGSFSSAAFAADVAAFFAGGKLPSIAGATHDYAGAMESIGRAAAWASVEKAEVCAWVKK